MKVAVLQSYLKALREPLQASQASKTVLGQLDDAIRAYDAFSEKDVGELAAFLVRAKGYEEQGQWPANAPRAAKKKPGAKVDLGREQIDALAGRLRAAAGTERLSGELEQLEQLKIGQLREVLSMLAPKQKATGAAQAVEKITAALAAPRPSAVPSPANVAADARMSRFLETLKALKAKADGPDAPFDEIEAELASLEQQLDARDAIQLAKDIGIHRTVSNRQDALDAIRRKVLEMKIARESIAF